jgi:DNA-binding Lrp family transcriptional regulator
MSDESGKSGRSNEYSDTEILQALNSEDERQSTEDIAEKVGCHTTTASRRLSDLESQGLVKSRRYGKSLTWEIDEESELYIIPIGSSFDILSTGLNEGIKISRDGVPHSVIPEEISDYEEVYAWIIPEENEELFNELRYGDVLLFYYEYDEPIRISGARGEVILKSEIVGKSKKPEVRDYLWPNKDWESTSANTVLIESPNYLGVSERILQRATDTEDFSKPTKIELTNVRKPKTRPVFGLLEMSYVSEEEVREEVISSDLIDGEAEKNVHLYDLISTPDINKILTGVRDEQGAQALAEILFPSAYAPPIEMVMTSKESVWLISSAGSIRSSRDKIQHLYLYTYLCSKFDMQSNMQNKELRSALVSGPPVTQSEEVYTEMLEGVLKKQGIDLFLKDRDF